MTEDEISQITILLSTMKGDPKWSDNHVEAYMIGLCDVPSTVFQIMRRELLNRWDWRPSVKELRDFARSLISTDIKVLPSDIVAEISGLISQYGECGVRKPGTNFYTAGAPPFSSALVEATVNAMGGWVNLCQDTSPSGVIRGQMLKIAQSVVSGQTEDSLKQLQIEYREQKLAVQLEYSMSYFQRDDGNAIL